MKIAVLTAIVFLSANTIAQTHSIQADRDKPISDALAARQFDFNKKLVKIGVNYGPAVYRLSTIRGILHENISVGARIALPDDSGVADRILGGHKATAADYPWQVALLNSSYGTLFCGGSHIGAGWIVTAAHCVRDDYGQPLRKEDITVLVGTPSLIFGGQRFTPTAEPLVHEDWKSSTKANDIALLRIPINAVSHKVILPTTMVEAPMVAPGYPNLAVSGWGQVTDGGDLSTDLLWVLVPIPPQSLCKTAYAPTFNIDFDTQVCAGATGIDSCQGDSGGPLSVPSSDGSKSLVGVVSYGKGCGTDGFPGVYTRVIGYREWIRKKSGL